MHIYISEILLQMSNQFNSNSDIYKVRGGEKNFQKVYSNDFFEKLMFTCLF